MVYKSGIFLDLRAPVWICLGLNVSECICDEGNTFCEKFLSCEAEKTAYLGVCDESFGGIEEVHCVDWEELR